VHPDEKSVVQVGALRASSTLTAAAKAEKAIISPMQSATAPPITHSAGLIRRSRCMQPPTIVPSGARHVGLVP
jgi:hypothetical protein